MIEKDKWPDHSALGGGEDAPDVKPAEVAAALLDHRFTHASSPSALFVAGLGVHMSARGSVLWFAPARCFLLPEAVRIPLPGGAKFVVPRCLE
jgi:hypothetical protein